MGKNTILSPPAASGDGGIEKKQKFNWGLSESRLNKVIAFHKSSGEKSKMGGE